ncbi:hypothetical protein PpBr36_08140 [Pyricularia pennisetigena]|uniref:hypothetical protein n=1 Tax=Pyricularia pennisetigena TaxID=1578925 RepID=UPI0011522167|nr:hypothetical protein PpBr36_08140 [Pyricularia pennisetigena]TLS23909.1 hypothetical protein PpBr36_08140 [Pyricularia pennisetigena]
MPGRQSHGRSLLDQPRGKGKGKGKKPQQQHQHGGRKPGSRATALDAFAIAAREVPTKSGIRGTRARDLDFEPNQRKRGRDEEDEDDDDDDGDDDDEDGSAERRKRAKRGGEDDDVEYGSDSEGNEFMMGEVDEDDDSEIDSDEAFGESDEDRFDGYTFRGSSSNKKPAKRKPKRDDDSEDGEEEEEEEEDDEDAEDGSSLGEDAIDLAAALDQMSDDDDGSEGDTESGSEEGDDDDSSSDSSMSDDDDQDPSKLDALQSLATGFAGNVDDDEPVNRTSGKAKVNLSDLTSTATKEPSMKKTLKQLHKDSKAADKPGSSQKLDVPLAKRQQDRLLRITAAEQAHKTLDRWQDTVKNNRRAEHLVFPLPDTQHDAGLSKTELAPLDKKSAGNELEQTILSIMEESGLGPSTRAERKADGDGAPTQSMTHEERQELQAQRRRERELKSREQARAARIKKIKSKAYRRVHRKEKQKALELGEEGEGEPLDSEEEREAQHRARALERVGAKHRDSKWARSTKKAGIAGWDENARTGLIEMARRDQELRRRVEGRGKSGDGDSEDDESEGDSGSDDEDGRRRLLLELEKAEAAQDEPQSELMKMKFMQRGEAVRKEANDALVAQLRRELNSEDEPDEDDEDEPTEVGRRVYGGANTTQTKPKKSGLETTKISDDQPQKSKAASAKAGNPFVSAFSAPSAQADGSEPGAAGSWSRAGAAKRAEGKSDKRRKAATGGAEDAALDIDNTVMAKQVVVKAKKPKTATGTTAATATDAADGSDSEAEAELHMPLGILDKELADRAFAGEDLVASFEQEKTAVEEEDDDKVIDNTLPGWGSWGGAGVSNRQRKNQKKFLTKVEGVKKKDRKDAKLERVIISEKRIKKNDKYLASQLPHEYENKDQYERSLRLPVGPEWTTKQTFQSATKPRILMKQGIIAPMAKPMSR